MSLYNKGIFRKWLEKWGLAAVMLLVLSTFTLSSQEDRRERRNRRNEAPADTTEAIPVLPDSLRAVRDSIHRADSLHAIDSLNMLHKSSLEAPAFTTARDSIIIWELFVIKHCEIYESY